MSQSKIEIEKLPEWIKKILELCKILGVEDLAYKKLGIKVRKK